MNRNIWYEWTLNPPVLFLAAIMVYFFYRLNGFRYKKNTYSFSAAVLLLLFCTCSPLHYLAMHFYFMAHMATHVILLLICGPLLVMAIPSNEKAPATKVILSISAFLNKRPVVAWLAGVGIMWLLHIPFIFDGSFAYMHKAFGMVVLLHSGSMVLAGMLFSWPLFGPVTRYHIHRLAGVVYLFTACISCSLLGLLITFAPLNTYHHYAMMGAMMGAANPLGITAMADQQAAGLIMWVPCCFVYLTGCLYLLQQWFATGSADHKSKLLRLKNTNAYE